MSDGPVRIINVRSVDEAMRAAMLSPEGEIVLTPALIEHIDKSLGSSFLDHIRSRRRWKFKLFRWAVVITIAR